MDEEIISDYTVLLLRQIDRCNDAKNSETFCDAVNRLVVLCTKLQDDEFKQSLSKVSDEYDSPLNDDYDTHLLCLKRFQVCVELLTRKGLW